jgi:CHAD domain-containing protein
MLARPMAVSADIPGSTNETSGSIALPWFDASLLRAYACGELDRAIAHLGWRGGRVHEGVHQARKSLRRTRATLALGGAVLGPGADLIDREIRRVTRSLSKMRDAQALVETLDRLIAKGKAPEALPVLRRARRTAAIARVESARRELASDPGLARKRALLATLRAALPALPWDSLTETRVRDAFADGLVRIDIAGARARATRRDNDWHRWRRRVRRLSQQHRATGSLIGDISSARRRIKNLAELLGEGQDYALIHDHCGKRSIFADPDRQILAALADLGTERMRARVEDALANAAPLAAETSAQ